MALGVTAYSEAPFSAEDSSVIVYPLGIQLTAQENSGIINIDVDVSVTGQQLTATSGTADGSSLVVVNPTGQALTAAEGTLDQSSNQEIDVTGFDLIGSGSALCSVIFATSLFKSGLVSRLISGFCTTD